jgi:hypothetical protein
MTRKKKPFRLEGNEKGARLDIRINEDLRVRLEDYCRKNKINITEAVTKAVEGIFKTNPQ